MAKPSVGASSLLCICIRQNRCASDSIDIYTNYRTTQAICTQLPLTAFSVFAGLRIQYIACGSRAQRYYGIERDEDAVAFSACA